VKTTTKVTARKFEGDDSASWAVFRSDKSRPVVTGLTKREVPYYKKLTLEAIAKESPSVPMKLTDAQIKLGSEYLGMSNLCTLDHYRKDIKDLPSLKRAVHQAWEQAVTGTMEGMDGGYNDRDESKAMRMVQDEIDMFAKDLRNPKKAGYWIEQFKKEIPFLFQEVK
jgi:hypothetical protein